MLHRKHTVKDSVVISKKESRKLREDVVGSLEKKHDDCLESFWKKSDPVTKITWEFSSGGSVVLYLLNNVPLVLSTTSLPHDAQDILPRGRTAIVPTLFFFFMMRNFYKGADSDVASLCSPQIWCRGPTSQFVISGAHLMMPGVLCVGTRDETEICVGDVVFIFSIGNRWPYGVGLATTELAHKSERGRGVYVLHSFKDPLWDAYFANFSARCGNASSVLPTTFQETAVLEDMEISSGAVIDNSEPEGMINENVVGLDTPDNYTQQNGNELLKTPFEVLKTEDGVIDFALCETIRGFSQSMLPMPLTEFLPLLLSNFPRIPGTELQVDFKNTKYKRALPYLLSRKDLVTVSEGKKGIYSIVHIDKSAELLRQHRHTYAEFLRLVHDPAKEEKFLKAEQQAVQNGRKGMFNRRIISLQTLFAPRGGGAMELKRILCTGVFSDVGHEKYLGDGQYQQRFSQNSKDDDAGFLDDLYSRKHLCDNLREYTLAKGLLQTGDENGGPPFVQLSGALLPLSKGSVERLRITEVDALLFQQLFVPVHQIAMENTPIIDGVAQSKTLVTRILKKGNLPKVVLYTERRVGNKLVTIVKYLDAYGFELVSLANQWKEQFSTHCNVHDPSKEMQRVKDGTKIILELHLGGDWVSKLKVFLEKELGIPHHLIAVGNKK